MSIYVIRHKESMKYLKGKYGTLSDLQDARTYTRKCDAANHLYYNHPRLTKEERYEAYEIVPCVLVPK